MSGAFWGQSQTSLRLGSLGRPQKARRPQLFRAGREHFAHAPQNIALRVAHSQKLKPMPQADAVAHQRPNFQRISCQR